MSSIIIILYQNVVIQMESRVKTLKVLLYYFQYPTKTVQNTLGAVGRTNAKKYFSSGISVGSAVCSDNASDATKWSSASTEPASVSCKLSSGDYETPSLCYVSISVRNRISSVLCFIVTK